MILVTVTGTFKKPDGSAAAGYVTFTPAPQIVADTSDDSLVVADTVAATLDSTGSFSVQLASSTDTNLSPHGWTYTVQENITGVAPRTYSVDIAGPGPVDLFDLAPVPRVLGGLRLVPGPQGAAGIPGAPGATGATGATGPAGPHDGTQNEYGYSLNAGCGCVPFRFGMSVATIATGAMLFTFFRAPKSFTANTVRFAHTVNATNVATTAQFGVWTVDATTGNLTALIGSTANDTTLFSAGANAAAPRTKALSAGVALTQDTWYAVGLLIVAAGTGPTVGASAVGAGGVSFMPLSLSLPRLSAGLSGQSSLPATASAVGYTSQNVSLWAELIP